MSSINDTTTLRGWLAFVVAHMTMWTYQRSQDTERALLATSGVQTLKQRPCMRGYADDTTGDQRCGQVASFELPTRRHHSQTTTRHHDTTARPTGRLDRHNLTTGQQSVINNQQSAISNQ